MERLEVPATPIKILTCGLDVEDRSILQAIFKAAPVTFIHTRNVHEAMPALLRLSAGVVLVERELDDGRWEDLFEVTPRSHVVVVDRWADNPMLAQVLNLGAHDLEVSQPLDEAKIERTVILAWYHWLQRWGKQ